MIKEKKGLVIAAGIILALSALSLAGKWDSELAEIAERDYCERVSQGIHSDYESHIDCE